VENDFFFVFYNLHKIIRNKLYSLRLSSVYFAHIMRSYSYIRREGRIENEPRNNQTVFNVKRLRFKNQLNRTTVYITYDEKWYNNNNNTRAPEYRVSIFSVKILRFEWFL